MNICYNNYTKKEINKMSLNIDLLAPICERMCDICGEEPDCNLCKAKVDCETILNTTMTLKHYFKLTNEILSFSNDFLSILSTITLCEKTITCASECASPNCPCYAKCKYLDSKVVKLYKILNTALKKLDKS